MNALWPVCLTFLCLAPVSAANHTVQITYYGDDFSVTPAVTHLNPGDTVTFKSDDPGTLYLRLGDDGKLFRTDHNQMTFTAAQIQRAGVDRIRCSMVTEGGVALGWETIHRGPRVHHDTFTEPEEVQPGSEAVTDLYGGTIIIDLSVPVTLWDRLMRWAGWR